MSNANFEINSNVVLVFMKTWFISATNRVESACTYHPIILCLNILLFNVSYKSQDSSSYNSMLLFFLSLVLLYEKPPNSVSGSVALFWLLVTQAIYPSKTCKLWYTCMSILYFPWLSSFSELNILHFCDLHFSMSGLSSFVTLM